MKNERDESKSTRVDQCDPNKIYYSLPDFYNLYDLNLNLISLMNKYPGWFRDNVVVDSVYGCFPGCIWNGGRVQLGGCSLENMAATINGFNQIGISVRFTFTNKQAHLNLYDHYANTILSLANNGLNGVNVSSDKLGDHIRTHYENYYIISSTTRDIKTTQDIDRLCENYDIVVAPYTINNSSAIPELKHPEKIELLCCETCIDNCPNRQYHYESISKAQSLQPSEPFRCPHGCELYYYYETIPTRGHYISPEMIEQHYLPKGFNKFKISGRNDSPIHVIERYVTYLAKPEFKDTLRNHLLINHFSGYQRVD